MPGNETIYKSTRYYFPLVWTEASISVGADRTMEIASFPVGLDEVPIAIPGSVTGVICLLSAAVTNGTLTVELRKNSVNTGEQLAFTTTDGASKILTLAPGTVTLAAGDTLGMRLTTSTPFAPSGTLNAVVYLEMQSI